jgi:phosphoribosyl-dephospho-CoA transferase
MSIARDVQPHDLLWGMPVSALADDAPDWCLDVIRLGHPVVVRRAHVGAGRVAVGVRGQSRDLRHAAVMSLADVTRQVRPEQVIDSLTRRHREQAPSHKGSPAAVESRADWPALQALRQVRPVLDALGLVWGVGGSAGFEWATGIAVLHRDSDLDLILRTPKFFDRPAALNLLTALQQAVCRIDLQLQTPNGAVALREWAGTSRQVLLKAEVGARLVSNPWAASECVA